MKRLTLCLTLAGALAFGLTAHAITVDELLSQLEDKYDGVETIVAEQTMEGVVSQGGMNMEMTGSGTLKLKYKEEKTLVIFEQAQNMTMPMMGEMEIDQTMAYDGEEALVLIEAMGQTQALRVDKGQLGELTTRPAQQFTDLQDRGYTLLVSEDEVDGTPVYALKAETDAEDMPTVTAYYGKDSLFPVKQISDGPGQNHMEVVFTSYATNQPLDDSIFHLAVPEGVTIMDADQLGGMMGGGQGGSAPEGS